MSDNRPELIERLDNLVSQLSGINGAIHDLARIVGHLSIDISQLTAKHLEATELVLKINRFSLDQIEQAQGGVMRAVILPGGKAP